MTVSRMQFKTAFLQQCAAAGLAEEDALQVVKAARDAVTKDAREKQAVNPGAALLTIPGVGAAWGAAKSMGEKLPGTALAAYITSALGLGSLGGYGVAKLQSLNDEDAREINTREKIRAYRQAAQQADVQRRLRQTQEASRPRRPLLT